MVHTTRSGGRRGHATSPERMAGGAHALKTPARIALSAASILIAALLLAGEFPDRRLATAAGVGCALLIGIVTVFALALRSEQVAVRLQDVLVRLAARLPSRFEKRGRRIAESVLRLRHQTIGVL